jgi:hypothetical protein
MPPGKWLELLISFSSGVVVTSTAAVVANILTKRRERQGKLEDRRFSIYMMLLEMSSIYFCEISAEARKDPSSLDMRRKIFELSWRISDQLRAADNLEEAERILEILFSGAFDSPMSRHNAMEKLIEEMGKKVNPRYSTKMREISGRSAVNMDACHPLKSRPPGAMF